MVASAEGPRELGVVNVRSKEMWSRGMRIQRDVAWLPAALVKASTSSGPRDLETVRSLCAVHTVHEESRRRGDRDRGDPKSRWRLWMRDTRRDRLVTPGGVYYVQMGRVDGFPVWASKPGACLLVCDAQV